MALYDSVEVSGSGCEERVERIKERANSKTGSILSQRQHAWSGQMIPKQLILQKQEMKMKMDEELVLGTLPENLGKVLNFKQIEEWAYLVQL